MITVHATTRRHLRSILKHGLQRQRATQKRKACWLGSQDRVGWCVQHAMRRHGIRPEDVVVLTLEVPDDWLRGFRYQGVYYVQRDVPAECIRSVQGYALVTLEV